MFGKRVLYFSFDISMWLWKGSLLYTLRALCKSWSHSLPDLVDPPPPPPRQSHVSMGIVLKKIFIYWLILFLSVGLFRYRAFFFFFSISGFLGNCSFYPSNLINSSDGPTLYVFDNLFICCSFILLASLNKSLLIFLYNFQFYGFLYCLFSAPWHLPMVLSY